MTAAWVAALVLPAVVAALVIAVARRSLLAARFADIPNARSMHSSPTPRIGGLGLLAGALPIAFFHADAPLAAILACALFLGVVSAIDDVRSLPIQVRLPAHVGAAFLALLAAASPESGRIALGLAGLFFCLVGLAYMANVFNFLDGVDGMAGGMGVIGFAALAWVAHDAGFAPLAFACAAIASASAGFLLYNFPPAKVFLGDAGSIPLGFLAGALGGYGYVAGAWPAWLPLLVFSPFIADASVTILQRMLRRERIWEAHRSHHYQRLALAGWPRRRLALAAYALMLAVSGTALVARGQDGLLQCGIIAVWLVAYLVIGLAIGPPRSGESNKKIDQDGATSFERLHRDP